MAEHLASEAIRPALVLCSSARRARETLDALASAMGDEVDVRVEDDLYGADAEELLQRLRRVTDDVESCMLIGHNPALHELASELASDGEEDAVTQLRVKFPTGALATFELLDVGWSDLAPGRAYLARLVVPKELPEARDER
jgi:phosphohistidine phosphatase